MSTSRSTRTLVSSTRDWVRLRRNRTVFIDWKGKRGQNLKWNYLENEAGSDGERPVEEDWVPAVGLSKVRTVRQAVGPESLVVRKQPLVVVAVLEVLSCKENPSDILRE